MIVTTEAEFFHLCNKSWKFIFKGSWHGGVVINTVTSQKVDPGFKSPSWGLCEVYILVSLWVLSRYSSFFPQSKNRHMGQVIWALKLAVGLTLTQLQHDPEVDKQK